MVRQNFLNTGNQKHHPVFADEFSILGFTFNTHSGSSQLCLRLHILLSHRLEVNQSWALKTCSGHSGACTQLWACMWPSGVPGICWAFQSPYEHLINHSLSPSFLVSSSFATMITYCFWRLWIKHCPVQWMFFTNDPWKWL